MDLRFALSLTAGKIAKAAINRFGGGGTAAPGLLSQNLDTDILQKLAAGLEKTILVTGTNGKTTTTRLVGAYLENEALPFVHNRQGSNLERGLISSLLSATSPTGSLNKRIGLFEVDEAALSVVINKVKPTALVINNLFRDQLDRYGEIDNIKKLWAKNIVSLGSETILILNADDPTVAYLGKSFRGQVVYFGLEDKKVSLDQTPTALDSIKCPNCHAELAYSAYYISHQGKYECKKCNFARPLPEITAKNIKLTQVGGEFTLEDKTSASFELETSLPGLYNVYNCLASYAALSTLNESLDNFPSVIKNFKPAFGRTEKLEMEGRKIVVALAKNPTGFNEVLRTFLSGNNSSVMLAINDLIADGRDVSWLWDVDFESLQGRGNNYFCSGIRAADIALRLKYSEVGNYKIETNLEKSLEEALSSIPQNDTLTIIPTYTAMLEMKKIFAKKGISGDFWED